MTGSFDKSRCRHTSTAALSSPLALLISVGEILRPISLSEIMERLRMLTPDRNKTLCAMESEISIFLLGQKKSLLGMCNRIGGAIAEKVIAEKSAAAIAHDNNVRIPVCRILDEIFFGVSLQQ